MAQTKIEAIFISGQIKHSQHVRSNFGVTTATTEVSAFGVLYIYNYR